MIWTSNGTPNALALSVSPTSAPVRSRKAGPTITGATGASGGTSNRW